MNKRELWKVSRREIKFRTNPLWHLSRPVFIKRSLLPKIYLYHAESTESFDPYILGVNPIDVMQYIYTYTLHTYYDIKRTLDTLCS